MFVVVDQVFSTNLVFLKICKGFIYDIYGRLNVEE